MGSPGREKRKGEKERASPARRSSVGKAIEATEAARHVAGTVYRAGGTRALRLQRMTGLSSSSVRA